MTWTPNYTITPTMARQLMEIEAARVIIERTQLPPQVQAELRRQARLAATHYSTYIEGNRLTLLETQEAIESEIRSARFKGRERDVREVQNYWNALLQVEAWASDGAPITEERIRRLHALVEFGRRAKATPYRDGQNSIRDSLSGALVYLPPEASHAPSLMTDLVAWIAAAERDALPIPLIAGLAHYQFVTIHPFYDGNGRTARLLATLILHRGGYGLNGFFSLEEFHARGLRAYYAALQTHPHHNYYEGRATADLTGWIAYFVDVVANVFQAAQEAAGRLAQSPVPAEQTTPGLDARQRRILGLFAQTDQITSAEVAAELGIAPRTARDLLRQWVETGWLTMTHPSNRKRAYSLSADYRQVIGRLSAERRNQ